MLPVVAPDKTMSIKDGKLPWIIDNLGSGRQVGILEEVREAPICTARLQNHPHRQDKSGSHDLNFTYMANADLNQLSML